jgi:hypothetical protein
MSSVINWVIQVKSISVCNVQSFRVTGFAPGNEEIDLEMIDGYFMVHIL